jgi:hypothetical protein
VIDGCFSWACRGESRPAKDDFRLAMGRIVLARFAVLGGWSHALTVLGALGIGLGSEDEISTASCAPLKRT